MVVEISLVYFSYAKADYVSEIPVMSDIPTNDVTNNIQKKSYFIQKGRIKYTNVLYTIYK